MYKKMYSKNHRGNCGFLSGYIYLRKHSLLKGRSPPSSPLTQPPGRGFAKSMTGLPRTGSLVRMGLTGRILLDLEEQISEENMVIL